MDIVLKRSGITGAIFQFWLNRNYEAAVLVRNPVFRRCSTAAKRGASGLSCPIMAAAADTTPATLQSYQTSTRGRRS